MTTRVRHILLTTLLFCIALVTSTLISPAHAQDTPWNADRFVDSIGINTHIPYTGTPYADNFSQCKSLLVGLGVRHIRDTMVTDNSGNFNTNMPALGAAGIKCDLILQPSWYTVEGAYVVANQYLQGCQEIVEGPNEWDYSGDMNWMAEFNTETTQIPEYYTNMPIYAGTIVGTTDLSNYINQYGTVTSYVNYGNCHPYCWALDPNDPEDNLSTLITWWDSLWGNDAFVLTETGYFTGTAQDALDPTTDAKYELRSLFSGFNTTAYRTYLYELYDEGTDVTNYEDNFGIVSNNGTVKPAYTAIKNIIALLSDPGPAFSTTPLYWSASGNTSNFNYTLMQKRNGVYYMALWIGGASTSTTKSQAITLSLPTSVTKATLYTLNTTGNLVTTAKTVSKGKCSFNITDQVSVLEF